MHLTFPNGEHPNVAFDRGEISIGSRADRTVCLSGRALAPHHASFLSDRRGMWLRVPPGTPGVHLNARPVRRLARLQVGDQICLEQIQVVIGEGDAAAIDRNIPASVPPVLAETHRASASRVVLRAISGSHFGRSFSLVEPKIVGRSPGCDIRIDDPALADRHAQFELHSDRVVLRALSQAEGSVVNGVTVRDAVLSPGDQIVIDQHRFVLEAPGLPVRGQSVPVRVAGGTRARAAKAAVIPMLQDSLGLDSDTQPPSQSVDPGALWWLIAAAAVLAAAMTALLVYSPHIGAA